MQDSAAMPFSPVNDEHAVVSASFTVYLGRPITHEELEGLFRRRSEIEHELPAVSRGDVVPVDSTGNQAGPDLPALEFSYLRPNGSSIWKLKVGGYEVVVECTRYTRWARVWQQAKFFFEWALKDPDMRSMVVSSSLLVQDRFVGKDAPVDFSQVFNRSCYLPEFVFGKERAWHCHSGWFDGESNGVLNNLNIDSRREGGNLVVSIHHLVRSSLPGGLPDLELLSELMDGYHLKNKEVLDAILLDSLKDKIGLNGVSK